MTFGGRSSWLARHILPHERALRAWLGERSRRGLEVDDIIQETYAVLAALPSTDHIASPRAYAFRTAWSIVVRHLSQVTGVPIEALGFTEWLRPVEDPPPEPAVSSHAELQLAPGLIEQLPARCREAFTLSKVAGMSRCDVAQRMGIPERAVEALIGQALRTLMDACKEEGSLPGQLSDEPGRRDILAMTGPKGRQGH